MQERLFQAAPPSSPGDLSALVAENPAALKALFDGVPASVLVLDGSEHLIFANHEFYRFTGLPVDSVIGAHIGEIIGSEGYHFYDPLRERVFRGETVAWEGWINLPNMGPHYFRESLVPYGPPGERPRAFVVMSLDLTEHKKRELELDEKVRALEAAESLKASIVDNALAALISTDDRARIVDFNPAAEKMFGRSRQSVIGQPLDRVTAPERHWVPDDARRFEALERWAARPRDQAAEVTGMRADGSECPMEATVWRTLVGDTRLYTVSLLDTSERKAAALQLQRERERLRQSEKLTAMGSLLAGVAHELNNPLAVVMGRADLLAEKCADDPDLQGDARRIREAAERCGRIVRTFLNMARSRPAVRTPTSLNDLARAAVEMLAYTYRTSGIHCQVTLDPRLPDVEADGDQIGQVVLNLLVNAQQALAQREAGRTVVLTSGTDGHGAWLRVQDNGPGVPTDLRERIFDPFFTTKTESMGTGLGLSVSRSIIRDHGGDLTIDVAGPERGASFVMHLPMRAVGTEAHAGVAPDPATPPVPATAARILIVDDEPELAAMMRSIVEAAGHEVATAESGAVALELLGVARFDAIVSDLRMPDMDGAALWRAVHERDPALARRVLFVTGDTLSPDARSFLASHDGPVLDKPFTARDLRSGVAALLALRP